MLIRRVGYALLVQVVISQILFPLAFFCSLIIGSSTHVSVAELANALGLGPSAERLGGSSPSADIV